MGEMAAVSLATTGLEFTVRRAGHSSYTFTVDSELAFNVNYADHGQDPKARLSSVWCGTYCRPRSCARCSTHVDTYCPSLLIHRDAGLFEEWFSTVGNPLTQAIVYASVRDRAYSLEHEAYTGVKFPADQVEFHSL